MICNKITFFSYFILYLFYFHPFEHFLSILSITFVKYTCKYFKKDRLPSSGIIQIYIWSMKLSGESVFPQDCCNLRLSLLS